MKRIKFLILFALLSDLAIGQFAWTDSIDFSNIPGADTVIWKGGRNRGHGGHWSLELEFIQLNANDATFSLGGSNYGYSYNEWDDPNIPITLNKTTYTKSVNGTNRCTVAWSKSYFPFEIFAIKINKGSVTDGTVHWRFVQE